MDFWYECIMHHWGCLLEAYFIFWWLYCLQETDTKAGYMCENLCVKNPVIKQMRGGNKDSQTESLLINQTKLTAELSNSFFSFSSRRERHCWNIRAEKSRIHWGHVKLMSHQIFTGPAYKCTLPLNVPSPPPPSQMNTQLPTYLQQTCLACSHSSVWFVMGYLAEMRWSTQSAGGL